MPTAWSWKRLYDISASAANIGDQTEERYPGGRAANEVENGEFCFRPKSKNGTVIADMAEAKSGGGGLPGGLKDKPGK